MSAVAWPPPSVVGKSLLLTGWWLTSEGPRGGVDVRYSAPLSCGRCCDGGHCSTPEWVASGTAYGLFQYVPGQAPTHPAYLESGGSLLLEARSLRQRSSATQPCDSPYPGRQVALPSAGVYVAEVNKPQNRIDHGGHNREQPMNIGGRHYSRTMWLLAWVLAALWCLQGAAAQAADDTTGTASAAKLAVVGADTIEVELDDYPEDGVRKGTATVLVGNTGTGNADVTAVLLQTSLPDSCERVRLDERAPKSVAPNEVVPIPVTFDVSPDCNDEQGTLLFEATDDATAPTSVQFEFFRDVGSVQYWLPLIGSLVAAVGFALGLVFMRSRDRLRQTVDMGSAWSFTDSWLTNVTALTAILGTVLTSSGILEDLLPRIAKGQLLAMNVLFGGLVLFAPVIYSALAVWKRDGPTTEFYPLGRVVGLIVASTASVAGSIGVILTLIIVTAAADTAEWVKYPIVTILAVVGVVVLAYAYVWTKEAIRAPATATPSVSQPGTAPVPSTSRSATL